MKKILLMILFISKIWGSYGCDFSIRDNLVDLKKQYKDELESTWAYRDDFDKRVKCQELSDGSSAVIVIFFRDWKDKDKKVRFSSIVAFLDFKKHNKITKSYFHKYLLTNISKSENIEFSIDETSYKDISSNKIISMRVKNDTYGGDGYRKTLYLYELYTNEIKIITPKRGIFIEEKKDCTDCIHSKFVVKRKKVDKNKEYPVLTFNRNFVLLKNKKEKWNVKLDDATYIFKNGVYEVKSSTPLFDLDLILEQAKKGLKFRKIVIEAILNETELVKESRQKLNDIGVAFFNNGKYEASELIFDKLHAFYINPKDKLSVESMLHLADLYMKQGKDYKAHALYVDYMEAWEDKKLPIPKRVLVYKKPKIELFSNELEKNFIKKYTKVESVEPLLFENKGIAKPLSVVPWMQKTLLKTSEDVLNLMAYEYKNEIHFLYETVDWNLYTGKFTRKIYHFKPTDKEPTLVKTFFSRGEYELFKTIGDKIIIGENRLLSMESLEVMEQPLAVGEKTEEEVGVSLFKSVDNQYTLIVDAVTLKLYSEKSNRMKTLFESKYFYNGMTVGMVAWSKDNKYIYFDNHGYLMACIWRYNIETNELSKIVPEHEAENPFPFTYKGREYLFYIEKYSLKIATPIIKN